MLAEAQKLVKAVRKAVNDWAYASITNVFHQKYTISEDEKTGAINPGNDEKRVVLRFLVARLLFSEKQVEEILKTTSLFIERYLRRTGEDSDDLEGAVTVLTNLAFVVPKALSKEIISQTFASCLLVVLFQCQLTQVWNFYISQAPGPQQPLLKFKIFHSLARITIMIQACSRLLNQYPLWCAKQIDQVRAPLRPTNGVDIGDGFFLSVLNAFRSFMTRPVRASSGAPAEMRANGMRLIGMLDMLATIKEVPGKSRVDDGSLRAFVDQLATSATEADGKWNNASCVCTACGRHPPLTGDANPGDFTQFAACGNCSTAAYVGAISLCVNWPSDRLSRSAQRIINVMLWKAATNRIAVNW